MISTFFQIEQTKFLLPFPFKIPLLDTKNTFKQYFYNYGLNLLTLSIIAARNE